MTVVLIPLKLIPISPCSETENIPSYTGLRQAEFALLRAGWYRTAATGAPTQISNFILT